MSERKVKINYHLGFMARSDGVDEIIDALGPEYSFIESKPLPERTRSGRVQREIRFQAPPDLGSLTEYQSLRLNKIRGVKILGEPEFVSA